MMPSVESIASSVVTVLLGHQRALLLVEQVSQLPRLLRVLLEVSKRMADSDLSGVPVFKVWRGEWRAHGLGLRQWQLGGLACVGLSTCVRMRCFGTSDHVAEHRHFTGLWMATGMAAGAVEEQVAVHCGSCALCVFALAGLLHVCLRAANRVMWGLCANCCLPALRPPPLASAAAAVPRLPGLGALRQSRHPAGLCLRGAAGGVLCACAPAA